MTTAKTATRPGSKWAHGKRRVLNKRTGDIATPKPAGRSHDWVQGAKVARRGR
jgi:hypothetical protein